MENSMKAPLKTRNSCNMIYINQVPIFILKDLYGKSLSHLPRRKEKGYGLGHVLGQVRSIICEVWTQMPVTHLLQASFLICKHR